MLSVNNDLQITFWSGVGTVTGANFLLESRKTKILIDCGLLQGTVDAYEYNKKPFPYDAKSIDFLFITHAHMDHIGRVCKLVKDGFGGIIYSTKETKDLANVMLMDAIKVMNMKEKMDLDGEKEVPLYELADFNKAMALWRTIPYHTKTKVNDEFEVTLQDAGHILGSSMFEFFFKGKKIVFTGDSGNSPAPLLKDTEKITDADYLIIDSVYGDRNHEDKDIRDDKFRKIVIETIEKGGTLVIPAFSVERTQVVLYELNNLVEEKKIPSVPVFLDSPLGLKVTDIYKHYSGNFNQDVKKEISSGDNIFNFPKLTIIHGRDESENIVKTLGPKIIIAGSGMSSGGRVVGHEMHFLPDPNNTVLLMGYQAVGTLGRRIQDKPKEVEINGSLIPVRARIEMISGYSSHKDSDGIVNMVADVADKVKKVFVVMGEPKSSIFLVQRLRDELEVDAVYPDRGIIYKLI
ncbi:MAG: metallo-beta-lactamase family protein [Parcubacteria bacterium C7867-003]|nr:MAG: metallo-beta-lactamase family protein [Parcubacteria bacterium C7867-003]